ncbi:hypothetical protein [Niabella beijingensis]|uniref:TapB family protein n=1 Tax=Niabella beijingensis TaxID=2872700 RepID=UPI001CBEF4E5|nr:hypothetical protein [Niabella beijingensis]MBZ4189656.1 hypothetical protein [Niabella beijingensis]
MKAKPAILLLLLLICNNSRAQCKYYFFQNNKTITLGIFGKNGSQDGKVVYKTTGVSQKDGATVATISAAFYDKKNKPGGNAVSEAECREGMLLVDMKMMLSPQQSSQMRETRAKGKGFFLEYPSGLSEGQELPDGNFEIDMELSGGVPVSMKVDIINRKVLAREKVTTPAGTWEAYKISYTSNMVMNMGFSVPIKMQMTEWFVPEFGFVKSASRFGRTELLSIE